MYPPANCPAGTDSEAGVLPTNLKSRYRFGLMNWRGGSYGRGNLGERCDEAPSGVDEGYGGEAATIRRLWMQVVEIINFAPGSSLFLIHGTSWIFKHSSPPSNQKG